MLICNDDWRIVKILDLFIFEFIDKGLICYMPLILTTRVDKQNQYGRFETAGALYNHRAIIYLFGALAFYFFIR